MSEIGEEEIAKALAWLGESTGRLLSFDGRTFSEDDNLDLWVVTQEYGSINDREWAQLGAGKTPAEAVVSAMRAAIRKGSTTA